MSPEQQRCRELMVIVGVETRRATGRVYQIDLEALDERSLREVLRLLRDMDDACRAKVRRAQLTPWRVP